MLYPANVLAKLARAYLTGSAPNGEILTFSDHMRMLVTRFADPLRYDCILVDARAGLHETTASAIVGLGAEVFLFGLDQPQTFAGYELLFAHLGTLTVDASDDWQEHLHLVQAKAPVDSKMRANFSERMAGLRSKYLSREKIPLEVKIDTAALKDAFEVDWDEDNSSAVESLLDDEPPTNLAILDDERFRTFDPLVDRGILAGSVYLESYGEFLEMAEGMVISNEDANSDIHHDD